MEKEAMNCQIGIPAPEIPSLSFEVYPYGDTEKVSDTLSKRRLRIFYKYLNRNRTYISDDFARQLIESLPYTPVKGIFDKDSLDFEGHGEESSEGKIYGIVPSEPNFAWEKHLDEDGVERLYACTDVLFYTALYPESTLAFEKSQSMEIYPKTMKGEWRIHEDGKPCFYFLKGCFLGLQILGDLVEPCFEGSAFYSLYQQAIQDVATYSKKIREKEEKKKMDKNLFRLSDSDKADLIFNTLNPNFSEQGNWEVKYMISDVFDDYALCFNIENKSYERVYYTKDNDADSVTVGEIVPVKIVDVTATEYAALETMKALGSYEEISENYNANIEKISALESEKTEFENKITAAETAATEFEAKISELTEANTSLQTQLEEKTSEFSAKIEEITAEKVRIEEEKNDITIENESLNAFKKNIENEQKLAILEDFIPSLSENQVESFKSEINKYSVDDFKKEVCAAAYESNHGLFAKQQEEPIYPKLTGSSKPNSLEEYLDSYIAKKGGNN